MTNTETKKILVVLTGGTICSLSDEDRSFGTNTRHLNGELARALIENIFRSSDSEYASTEICYGKPEAFTLSENMTPSKLSQIVSYLKSIPFSDYKGIIILHGTDTLAFTAALLSLIFSSTKTPLMLVSANQPLTDEGTNGNANFRTAVELIMNNISGGIYVPYRNTDGKMYIHQGSRIMQCKSYSENFYSGGDIAPVYTGTPASTSEILRIFEDISRKRLCEKEPDNRICQLLSDLDFEPSGDTLLVYPYTGLDYSRICLDGIRGIVHSTYHSGTFCVDRASPEEDFSHYSVLSLCEKCKKRQIPVFAAPCKVDSEQYSSVFDGVYNGGIIPLDMTTEAAYAKLIIGISAGLEGEALTEFMKLCINNEMVS